MVLFFVLRAKQRNPSETVFYTLVKDITLWTRELLPFTFLCSLVANKYASHSYVCYLSNILPVYEELARIAFFGFEKIGHVGFEKMSCQIFDLLKLFHGICFGRLPGTCFSHHLIWKYCFWNAEILSYNI